jgi:hypothetical protein
MHPEIVFVNFRVFPVQHLIDQIEFGVLPDRKLPVWKIAEAALSLNRRDE